MKRIFFLILTLCLLLGAVPAVYAEETLPEGETTAPELTATEPEDPTQCGEDLHWAYENGVLTVSGSGAMDDMTDGAPWAEYKGEITKVVLTGGVTTVGAYAFQDCDKLETVDFGGSLREIDTMAFQDCDGLKEIHLPATFKRFGKACFQDCSALTTVHCAGGMPSFNANCLWNGNMVTVYCPANNVWPEQYVQELEANFGGRLEILAETGEDPFDFTEATEPEETTKPEETTEATTEATEEVTEETVEETAAATEAPETEPVTEETTAAATGETAELTEEPVPETTVPAPPEEKDVRLAVILAIAAMALSAVGILTLSILLKRNHGGKYAK